MVIVKRCSNESIKIEIKVHHNDGISFCRPSSGNVFSSHTPSTVGRGRMFSCFDNVRFSQKVQGPFIPAALQFIVCALLVHCSENV